MNILQLSITDLKKVSAIEINPEDGKPVVLTGDNANGKSSVLESIILALSNKGLDDPIRHGRPSASVKLTLGSDKVEYFLERRITKKGDYLTLTDALGAPVAKAQTFLNGIIGNYAFDPLEFTKLKSKDQVEALKIAAGLDFSEVDSERAAAYSERTTVARDGKEVAAQLAAVPAPADDVPTDEVSASSLIEVLEGLKDKIRSKQTFRDQVTNLKEQVRLKRERINTLQFDLKAAENAEQELIKGMEERTAAFDAVTEPTEEELKTAADAVNQIDATNAAVRSARQHRELSNRVVSLRQKHAALSRRIEVVDERKAEAIKNANLPLEGLELTDDGVMFNGTFFTQLSTAEQIRISTLVAMSQNPGLKIIIIREGALMNTTNLALISKLAADRGFQLWIEKFQESPSDIGFHIVDGAIAFEDGEAVAPAPEPATIPKATKKSAPKAEEADAFATPDF
jgi:hypothetical protein